MKLLFLMMIYIPFLEASETRIAMVKLLKGAVEVVEEKNVTQLKINDWVRSGSIVKTQDKSFVKLIFIDKSQMNIGPNSEIKIESFNEKESGVIDLVKGKIRTQVTTDYMKINQSGQSKLFIKTKNAVLGIRGTDFLISTNGINTSTVLFEGEIMFNNLDSSKDNSLHLEDIVEKGVRIFPGEFSVVESDRIMPTVPALLNVEQREKLEKNNLTQDNPVENNKTDTMRTVVPEGLTGKMVSNSSMTLKNELSQNPPDKIGSNISESIKDPDGYVKGDKMKPANGSFLHIESGVIISPGKGAVLDSNSHTFIAGTDSGQVASDGTYIPPRHVEITGDGKIFVGINDSFGKMMMKEIHPPAPIMSAFPEKMGHEIFHSNTTDSTPRDIPLPGMRDVDSRFSPHGGIMNVNDPTRSIELSRLTIILNNN